MANRSEYSYFMSHILPVFKRAAVWDDNLCWIWQGIWGSSNKYHSDSLRVKIYVVGSCSDGGCSPRMYWTPPVLEVDRLLLFSDPGLKYGQPHPDKVGVFVETNVSRQQHFDAMVSSYPQITIVSPAADSPRHVRDAYQKAQDSVYPPFPKWYKQSNILGDSNRGPSVKKMFIKFNTHIHADQVSAYHHPGWPHEAEEWRTRTRVWPPATLVEQVINQGYQIVLKMSSGTGDMEGPVEWHITFAMCERYLARQRTPVQRLVYLMAKTLFYTYLDLHDDDNPNIEFPSYALKTCMMWLMEQTPVNRWTEDNVPYLLRELLTRLKNAACRGTLKNYFMIGVNVLSNTTPNLLKKCDIQITMMLSDMNKFLQVTELYKCNILYYGYHVMKGGQQTYDEIVIHYQNHALAHGLLQVLDNLHNMRATYQCITEILEQGTGEGLQAKGYLYDEEECFHILKIMMKAHSAAYMTDWDINTQDLNKAIHTTLGKYAYEIYELLENDVFSLDLPELEVTIIRLCVEWRGGRPVSVLPTGGCGQVGAFLQHIDEWAEKFSQGIESLPGVTDMVAIREGLDLNVHKWSSIGDLIDGYVEDLQYHEAGRWMPRIFSLTHREIPELQLMDMARMLYLLYVCDDKRMPDT